jgi:hypothetical protein
MRYIAPPRENVDPATFDHPVFARYAAHRDLLAGASWPGVETLNARLRDARLRFVPQTPALVADGLHYETRIYERGEIPTRERNWHDLLNALIWIEHRALKGALNARQAADIAAVGPKMRTRGQCALTHFDEAGAVVVIRDSSLHALWDAHDWHGLFWRARDAWSAPERPIEVVVFGHALLEHALAPHLTVVTKALAVAAADDVEGALAQAIRVSRALNDPQELRPLPLSGIPGWHADNAGEAFYREAPCFRPLRAGRMYPAPVAL